MTTCQAEMMAAEVFGDLDVAPCEDPATVPILVGGSEVHYLLCEGCARALRFLSRLAEQVDEDLP